MLLSMLNNRVPMYGFLFLVALLPMYSQAQQSKSSVNDTTGAETFDFSLPTLPLEQALERFARQTKKQVKVETALIAALISEEVEGSFTAEEALLQLLGNSGIQVNVVSSGDFSLSAASTPSKESRNRIDKDVEVIVVTGENIKRNLIDTNTSANIQTFDNIVRSNDKRISDVFSRAANVNVNGTGLQAFTFSIRGINSSGIGGAGNGAVASLTVDGAAFTTQQLSRGYNSLFDVKQVEMLRGPQSTSQARNSLAGAVVVQTNDPEFEQRTRATAAIGNYGTYELGVANTGPITDNFAYRITLHRLNTDGFITNTALGIDDYNFN
ncbi:MAG: TonB-dependent receptor plug domain-containing protein, partial [Pseudomonadota bacterium]